MRLRSLIFSAVALLGANSGCTDEERGVIEPPYASNGGGGSGGTSAPGGKSSGGGPSAQAGTSSAQGATSNSDAGADGSDNTAGEGPGAVGACELPWSAGTTGGDASCDLESLPDGGITLQGDITSDLILGGGKSYVLSGEVRVMDGKVLTIEPCTKIIGQDSNALLVILPGGKLEAVGEQDKPIVFTSSKPRGERAPGDWGGLILLGNARTNQATDITKPAIEGLVQAERYGSNTDEHNDESSGSLVYVRVEFVGKQISADNEVNGITFGAIGSGTRVSHVQVANCTDDCFEWFGGTVNADHLIALNCDDDEFDTDNGYSGRVQFAFGRQFPTTSEADSNGFEMDTANPFLHQGPGGLDNEADPVLPLTANQWSNVTLCGEGPTDSLSPPRLGAVLRRRASGSISNAIFTGFADGGIKLLNASTISVTHSAIFDNGQNGTQTLGDGSEPGTLLEAASANLTEAPAGFCDCWSDPPTPFPLSRVPGATPSGFSDSAADYVGAFRQADVSSNWMIGKWVSWDSE